MGGIRVTVDTVIFRMIDEKLNALLVKRKYAPFQGEWAIPGGFVHEEETLEAAASRELDEETGLKNVYLEQLYSFGDPERDPRGRVITITYLALLPSSGELRASTDASEAKWFPVRSLPKLAFDHKRILDYALERLRIKLEYTTAEFKLLPEKFTLTELQNVYEAVLNKKLDKRNFRRKIALLRILQPLNDWKREGISRPAQLFRFSARKFEKLKDKGILFPF